MRKGKEEPFYEIFDKNFFWKNQSISDYAYEISKNILIDGNKPTDKAFFNHNRTGNILNTLFLLDNLKEKRASSTFKVVYLATNIRDRIIPLEKGPFNKKKLQLILYSALNIAIGYEARDFIKYKDFQKLEEDTIVSKKELIDYTDNIIKLLEYDFLITYPDDILSIIQTVDKTNTNVQLTQYCKFVILFTTFNKNFIKKKKNLIVLSCYYYSKMKIGLKYKWSNDLQLLTGLEEKLIIKNIKQLIIEIKKKINLFCFLKDNYYLLI